MAKSSQNKSQQKPGIGKKITQYFIGVKDELKKVKWPSRQKTYKYTLIVVAASLATAVFLGGVDFLFSYFLNKFFI